jgi:hypothetical protein
LDNVLKAKLLFEISQIDKMLNESCPLLKLCKLKTHDFIEMSAAAMLLHSFYNGIENVLLLIFKHYSEVLPNGIKWHIELLDKAFVANGDRKQIFSAELLKPLDEYLKFRHFVRHSYGFQLEWPRMENLIRGVENIWESVKENIINFIGNDVETPNGT